VKNCSRTFSERGFARVQKHSLLRSLHTPPRQRAVSDGDAVSARCDAFTCAAQYRAREALKMNGTVAAGLEDSVASFHGSW
jgi:hypothetical protein